MRKPVAQLDQVIEVVDTLSTKWGVASVLKQKRGSVAVVAIATLWTFAFKSAESKWAYSLGLWALGAAIAIAYIVGQSYSDAVKVRSAIESVEKPEGPSGTTA
jgi:hypothetical protein